jgi:hypothetical protein
MCPWLPGLVVILRLLLETAFSAEFTPSVLFGASGHPSRERSAQCRTTERLAEIIVHACGETSLTRRVGCISRECDHRCVSTFTFAQSQFSGGLRMFRSTHNNAGIFLG